jgi:Zn/Cd-binding protein ZinT
LHLIISAVASTSKSKGKASAAAAAVAAADEEAEDENGEVLPEGFFDDPKLDAKVICSFDKRWQILIMRFE